jgi:hypothetical protein
MTANCKHETCELPASKAGYCNAHYIRKRRGRPMDYPIRKAVGDPERFWQKVDKADGCWEWTAHRGVDGYGRFIVDRAPRLAHRVAFEEANGPIPAGMEIDHLCHNRACVNPKHLRIATRSLNAQNMQGATAAAAEKAAVEFRKEHMPFSLMDNREVV